MELYEAREILTKLIARTLAFSVVCDDSNNPKENLEQGILTCDICIAMPPVADVVKFKYGLVRGDK